MAHYKSGKKKTTTQLIIVSSLRCHIGQDKYSIPILLPTCTRSCQAHWCLCAWWIHENCHQHRTKQQLLSSTLSFKASNYSPLQFLHILFLPGLPKMITSNKQQLWLYYYILSNYLNTHPNNNLNHHQKRICITILALQPQRKAFRILFFSIYL